MKNTLALLLGAALLLACSDPQPPEFCGDIGQQSVFIADTLGVDICTKDPDGEKLEVSATPVDLAVVKTVSATPERVTLLGVGVDSTKVGVTLVDSDGLEARTDFEVVVPNRPPVLARPFGDQEMDEGTSLELEVPDHFSDPDGHDLLYRAETSDPDVVRAVLTDSTRLVIEAVAEGTAQVTVTASDGYEEVSGSFEVVVVEPDPAELTQAEAEGLFIGIGEVIGSDTVSPVACPNGGEIAVDGEVTADTVDGDLVFRVDARITPDGCELTVVESGFTVDGDPNVRDQTTIRIGDESGTIKGTMTGMLEVRVSDGREGVCPVDLEVDGEIDFEEGETTITYEGTYCNQEIQVTITEGG